MNDTREVRAIVIDRPRASVLPPWNTTASGAGGAIAIAAAVVVGPLLNTTGHRPLIQTGGQFIHTTWSDAGLRSMLIDGQANDVLPRLVEVYIAAHPRLTERQIRGLRLEAQRAFAQASVEFVDVTDPELGTHELLMRVVTRTDRLVDRDVAEEEFYDRVEGNSDLRAALQDVIVSFR